MDHNFSRRDVLKATGASLACLGVSNILTPQVEAEIATRYDYAPKTRNVPLGDSRGIFPGRVAWIRDPKAAFWSGDLHSTSDQWWMDANNDQTRIDAMLSATIRNLAGAANDAEAWDKVFAYHNQQTRGRERRGYRKGEVVAIKVNLNNSSTAGTGNIINTSPQVTLAVVRQLVHHAGVAPSDIVIFDARRMIYPALLQKIWGEFKDARFVQNAPADPAQPRNPVYGDYRKLEAADWVEGISYSANTYRDARFIPRQIMEAEYLINLALIKAHSYPYSPEEGGDEGQTALSMTGKNQFGSIKGTPELHAAINTNQEGTPHAYSPIVDLAASPNLGGKTILYLLDGLYCGRRHTSFPIHFPNAPFYNRVEPYQNRDWPSCLLGSLDGVALDCVGLDILYSQSKNNLDANNHPRILIRENADHYLQEMAMAPNPPSGTRYRQNGRGIRSLGGFEHWDNDDSRQYSRNKDPKNGTGIELIYQVLG